MGKDQEVTSGIEYGTIDDECLPILKCVCGKRFDFGFFISADREDAFSCPVCGRKFYFKSKVIIYEVVED